MTKDLMKEYVQRVLGRIVEDKVCIIKDAWRGQQANDEMEGQVHKGCISIFCDSEVLVVSYYTECSLSNVIAR